MKLIDIDKVENIEDVKKILKLLVLSRTNAQSYKIEVTESLYKDLELENLLGESK